MYLERDPGRVPSTGASVPVELGRVTFLGHECVHPPVNFPDPVLLRF